MLLKLLETEREAKTLAVGCHDLGCFITHYPAGKGLVTGASSIFDCTFVGTRSLSTQGASSLCIDGAVFDHPDHPF